MIDFGKNKKGKLIITGVGTVMIDVRLSESHEFTARISDYPIEDGSVLTDHIAKDPYSVNLDCIISNNPLDFTGVGISQDRSQVAFEMLVNCIRGGLEVTLETSYATYKGALSKLSVKNDGLTGDAISFNVGFREIEKGVVLTKDKVTIEDVSPNIEGSGSVNSTDAEGVGDRASSEQKAGQAPLSIFEQADLNSDNILRQRGYDI